MTFTRNRIRHELLPLLEGWNPRLREHLAQMAELARDEEAWWEAELARLAPQILLPGPAGAGRRASAGGDGLSIEVTGWRSLRRRCSGGCCGMRPGSWGPRLIFPRPRRCGRWRSKAGPGRNWSWRRGCGRSERIARLRLAAGAGWRQALVGAEAPPEYAGTVPGEIEAPAFGVRLRAGCVGRGQWTAAERRVTLRNWKAGDRVTLRYSSGPRKVKEVLERLRVTGTARSVWPVLEMDGRIVWMQEVELQPEPGIAIEARLRD